MKPGRLAAALWNYRESKDPSGLDADYKWPADPDAPRRRPVYWEEACREDLWPGSREEALAEAADVLTMLGIDAEVVRLEQLALERYELACRYEREAEQLRERVAWLMLEEPSKTQGLYAAIDELQETRPERPAWLECVEAAARERLAQAIQEGKQPQGTAWNGHYLTAAKAILTAAGVPALLAALDRERERTRKGVRTPPPGHESQFYGAPQFLAACKERDRYRSALVCIADMSLSPYGDLRKIAQAALNEDTDR